MPYEQIAINRGKQSKAAIAIFVVLVSVLAALCAERPAEAQKQSETDLLEVGKPIERELKGDQSHSYLIRMAAGQYLQAAVEQKGIDVVVCVYAPDEKESFGIDSPYGAKGSDLVRMIAEAAGNYRLEVKSLKKQAELGRYEVKIEELRAAAERDRDLLEADRRDVEAKKLRNAGRNDEALPLFEQALEIREKTLGPNHPEIAASLNTLALIYKAKGNLDKAEPLYKRALEIREKTLAPDHVDVATSLHNLASLHYAKGDYDKAEPLYKKALEIRDKALGPDHDDVAASLNNLALLYYAIGNYDKAEPLYKRALEIYEKALGPDHLYVAASIHNLASDYKAKGDYDKAEPLYKRALEIREKKLAPDHPEVAVSIHYLASLYYAKGDYDKAEPLYKKALEIREKKLGPNHPEVAASLNNFALLYKAKGDYDKAEPLYKRALEIREKKLASDHLEVAVSLNNLASLYNAKGDYDKAEPLLQRALTIFEKRLGTEHPETTGPINNLAMLYYAKGDHGKAEPLLQRALTIREKALGPDHPYVVSSLNKLASVHLAKGDSAQAVGFQGRANDARERDLIRNLASGSERQKLAYLKRSSPELNCTLSLHLQSAPNDLTAQRIALEILLRRKGRALDAMTDSIAALRRRADAEDQKLLDELSQTRTRLSALILKGAGKERAEQHQTERKALENRIEELENLISSRSAEFRAQNQSITLDAVQKAIPAGAALIEFAAYRPYDAKTNKFGLTRYVAYVLNSTGEPLWAELGEAETINIAIADLRSALRDGKSSVERDIKPKARALDKLVMKPVREILGQTKRLLLSPDGVLNLIPFDALVDERGRFLVRRYEISYLTSGRDLLRLQTKIKHNQPPMVMADPDFGTGPGPKLGDNEYEPLKRLNASSVEAMQIKTKMAGVAVLLQSDATKNALKDISRPMLLHIATHGFFLKDESAAYAADGQRSIVRKMSNDELDDDLPAELKIENPLLRSGLFFAGANAKSNEATLTAMEAAGLDLWGTKLVVLSACDTGVGEAKNGDGVYGLRRALVLAGSESQLMSLWQVSDKGTRDLMTAYYEALKAGEGRSAGLRRVRLEMLKNPARRHPYYWSSFILSGEWASLDGKR